MIIQDGVAERRNLIVISLAIIVFYLAGGSVVDQKLKLPMVNVEFSEPIVLFSFVWVMFFYFIFRYRVTSKTYESGSIRRLVQSELLQLPINKKHYDYLFDLLKKKNPEDNTSKVGFRNWVLEYGNDSILFRGTPANGSTVMINIKGKGFRSHWIVFKTMVRAYYRYPNVNAYYTPYLLAWVAFFTLEYNTFLKICAEILKKSSS